MPTIRYVYSQQGEPGSDHSTRTRNSLHAASTPAASEPTHPVFLPFDGVQGHELSITNFEEVQRIQTDISRFEFDVEKTIARCSERRKQVHKHKEAGWLFELTL